MAINKKLIHFKTKQKFEEELAKGNILNTSIVFILDSKEIYTHGEYYGDLSECLTKYPQEFTKEEKDQMLENLGYYFIEWDFESETIVLSEEEYAKLNASMAPLLVSDGLIFYPTMFMQGFAAYFRFEGAGLSMVVSVDLTSPPELRIRVDEMTIPSKTSDLENDSNFISSDDLKTINGESILGSGDIVIEGGGFAYPRVDHGVTNTSFSLTPNTLHVWDEVASLDLSFTEGMEGVVNEYVFQFTSGATPTSLTLPDGILWVNGEPNIEVNKTYQVSIVNNIGLIVGV